MYLLKMFSKLGVYEGLNEIVLQLQMVIVYGYITYKVLINSIGIGDFTMYTNAAINFHANPYLIYLEVM